MNLTPFFFKPNLNSEKKKKKNLVFNLKNKKPINKILKNHKQKKRAK